MDYTTLAVADVRTLLADIGRDAQSTFGSLDARQLNWRPDPTRWSVGQCFDHLVTGNELMERAARDALGSSRRTVWQRMPLLPTLFGRALIRSQSPEATKRYRAPAPARPTTSDVAAEVITRFVDQHRQVVEWITTIDPAALEAVIMTSPFMSIVTYSVLDGFRLMVAHDRRHIEQARRVLQSPGFPNV